MTSTLSLLLVPSIRQKNMNSDISELDLFSLTIQAGSGCGDIGSRYTFADTTFSTRTVGVSPGVNGTLPVVGRVAPT